MTISICPATEADIPCLVRVELAAFQSHPRIPMLFPNGYTSDLYAYYEYKKLQSLHDSNSRLITAVDEATGTIVGASEVTFALDPVANEQRKPLDAEEERPQNWPEGANWEMRRWFVVNSRRLEEKSFAGEGYIVVDIIVVDPEYQGRGIGAQLLDWSIKQAEEKGVVLGLESSPAGLKLYEKHGFREVERIKADMKGFGWEEAYDEDEAMRAWMIRRVRADNPA